jgi:hypothetical protein
MASELIESIYYFTNIQAGSIGERCLPSCSHSFIYTRAFAHTRNTNILFRVIKVPN